MTALPKAEARLRQRRVRAREAVRRQLVPAQQLPVEPAVWQLLGTVAVGRKRPHQPERRPAFDYPVMMFQDGGEPAYGPLATDRPNQFKTQFIYQFHFGTSIGAERVRGERHCRSAAKSASTRPATCRCNYLGRGSDGRTPMFSQTDLFVQHSFRLAGSRQLQLGFNVLNLFNQKAAVSKYSDVSERQRRRPERGALLPWPADARELITSARTSQGSALPPGQPVSVADPGALWSQVLLLDQRREFGYRAPRGLRPTGLFFLRTGGRPCVIRLACLVALVAVSAHLLSAQPQRNQNRGRAMGPVPDRARRDAVGAVGKGVSGLSQRDRDRSDIRDGLLRARALADAPEEVCRGGDARSRSAATSIPNRPDGSSRTSRTHSNTGASG